MRTIALMLLLPSACVDDPPDSDTDVVPVGPVVEHGCEERHAPFIEALEADLLASGAPGVSAALMEDGVVTCQVARGTLEVEGEEPVTVDSLFQIGSTTKLFTCIATMQQVEAGLYAADATLADTYPRSEFARNADWNDAITVHHLMSQQSGMFDHFDWQGSSDDADLVGWSDSVLFPRLWLMNPPGAFWNYSNPNFIVAGLIVEENDPGERTYRDLMAEEVFAPLGMTRTVQGNDRAAELGNVASSYGLVIQGETAVEKAVAWQDAPDPAHGRPAGANTWSTPHDVLQAARLLVHGDGDVLADPGRRQLSVRHVSVPDNPAVGYGYGLLVSDGLVLGDSYYETPVWNHGGNTLSYTSEFYVLPEQDVGVSILSSGNNQRFARAVEAALRLGDLPEPSTPPRRDTDLTKLDDHVGDYEDAFNWGAMQVTREGDQLMVAMPDLVDLDISVQPTLRMITDATFVATIQGQAFAFTFVGEEGKPSTYMVNRSAVGTRVPARIAAPDRPKVSMPTLPLLGPGEPPGVWPGL